MKSLGFVEVSGVVAAVDVLDIMCKSAGVNFVTWERKLGGRLVTVIVEGSISDVTEAVENAREKCAFNVCAVNVIARPHSETLRMVELSASRMARQGTSVSASVENNTTVNEETSSTPSDKTVTQTKKKTSTRGKGTKKKE